MVFKKGYIPSEEQKIKQSKTRRRLIDEGTINMRKIMNKKVAGQISKTLKGHQVSEQTRKKISAFQQGIDLDDWKTFNVPEFKKIRNSKEYKLWRNAVFSRDNWTCKFCNKHGGNMEADHIKPFSDYPELRFAIDNGRTLCVDCHRKTDSFGWRLKWKKRAN
jgi:hypothetical protein